MILRYKDLGNYEKKVVMVDGCFDPLHIGHIKYFEAAAELGFPVLCNVQSDKYIVEAKNRPALLPEEQRAAVIDSIKHISFVHICRTSTADVLKTLKPAKYVKGNDWKQKGLPQEEVDICKEAGTEIVYLDTVLDSSTNIVENFKSGLKDIPNDSKIEAFETIVFSQKEIDSRHYDNHYFTGTWRSGENDYSIEKRRAIEAKNPANVKEVFNPKLVLDVGCGPGALMYFLYELGIKAYGIDFSPMAKELAPAEVRNNIVVAPVTEYHDFGLEFDLVICRELLEHLTVLQIRKAVAVLAKYTSKYLYLTTRFHPRPEHFLDVTDEKTVDPTHITLLNKDFLRTLFILEGLKSRKDLEEKMDWKKLGRVMVFEKVKGRR
jgi:glycerol-3-phosphate cytidylyltransferase